MANLKRYNHKYQGSGLYMMVECENGKYVKFDDIKEYLPFTSTNTTNNAIALLNELVRRSKETKTLWDDHLLICDIVERWE